MALTKQEPIAREEAIGQIVANYISAGVIAPADGLLLAETLETVDYQLLLLGLVKSHMIREGLSPFAIDVIANGW